MPTEQAVPQDHPLMKAWTAFQLSDEYKNAFKWAGMVEHRCGSMWRAYAEGWNARAAEGEGGISRAVPELSGGWQTLDAYHPEGRQVLLSAENWVGTVSRDWVNRQDMRDDLANWNNPPTHWQYAPKPPVSGTAREVKPLPHPSNEQMIAELCEALQRVTGWFVIWAADHADERTAEIDAAIYCAKAVLAKAQSRGEA